MANIIGPNGHAANVTDTGLLTVQSVSQSSAEVLNQAGGVFRVSGATGAVTGGNTFLYLRNVGTQDIALSVISVSSDTATTILTEGVAGTPVYVSETAADAINLNLGSTTVLLAEANIDSDITGLASTGQLSLIECPEVNTLYSDGISSSVFIPQGKAIALRTVNTVGFIAFTLGLGIVSI